MTTDINDQAPSGDRKAPNRGAKGGREDHDRITIRLLPAERAAVEAESRAAGFSMASYARFKLLGDAGPRARRSPPINAELLAQAVSQLNKAGTNLTEIVKAIGDGQHPFAVFSIETLAEVRHAVADIRKAVGRTGRS